jgi:pimeloyl-ACP methyl ester carboxylesterase
MHYLAEAGFDVFAMDHTGYGLSPRPEMDNPCNMPVESQSLLVPHFLPETCDPDYSQTLTTLDTDVDEVASVVSFILQLRGVERIHLVGWSAGGRRIAAYASEFPETVDRLFLYAPSVYTGETPPMFVQPNTPMRLQTRDAMMEGWESGIECDAVVDPGIQDVIWQTIVGFDPLALAWRPQGDAVRARTAPLAWDPNYARGIVSPTLMVVGEQDILLPYVRDLYEAIPATEKTLVNMECSTHFAVWETTQYRFLHESLLLAGSSRPLTVNMHGDE